MNQTEEQYIDHEVRIRVQEELSKDIKSKLSHMEDKMDSQFKWILGIIGGLAAIMAHGFHWF